MQATLELYSPTWAQYKVHQSKKKYNVVRFGRQSGKSTYGNNKLMERAWLKSNGMYWFVGPTYRLAEQMHDRAKFSLLRSGALKDKSDSDLMIQLKYSDSRIWYKSGDNPDALLGETLDGAIIDECSKQDREIWERYVMPMLGTTDGWCDFLSTPDGIDWFHDLDQNHLLDSDWGSFHAPSHSNPLWTKKKLEEAKANMSADLYAQEILAEFRNLGQGSCYTTFGEHNIKSSSPFAVGMSNISPYLPIIVGMDFNLSPMCWVLGQNRGRDFHWHDEIYQERAEPEESPTQSAAKELVRKVSGHGPGILIIGDASGKAGQRSAQAGQSDYDTIKQILKSAGIKYQDKTPDANPGIKDRVNTVNTACRSADGSVHMTFDPMCKYSIKDMRKRKWKKKSASLKFDDSDSTVGHSSDAVGYPVCVLAPIKSIASPGSLRIIQRSI